MTGRPYRRLLLLLPRRFRHEFGDALGRAFQDQAAAARGHGIIPWLRYLGRAVIDLLVTGVRLRLEGGREGLTLREADARTLLRSGVRVALAAALERLWFDVRGAFRALVRAPGYAGASLATLALAIGLNTAIFGIVHGVLLRPLPFQEGDRLVALRQEVDGVGGRDVGFSVSEIDGLRDSVTSLGAVVEYHTMSFTLLGGRRPQQVTAGVVSWEYFDFLGVEALHGRLIEPADERAGRPPILVMGHAYWLTAHGGDPGVVGRELRLADRAYRVIGVLPPVPQYPRAHDVYLPVSACPIRSDPQFIADPERRMMGVVARMAPGATVAGVRSELRRRAGQGSAGEIAAAAARGEALRIRTLPLHEELTRDARPMLLLLLLATGLVLAGACANVASLTLARAVSRRRETALRAALGAGRGRLLRQRAIECLVLSLAGAALGLVLAAQGSGVLVAFVARHTARPVATSLDLPVLGFAALLAVGSGLVAGILPSLPSAAQLATALRRGGAAAAGGRASGLRAALIGVQVAASVALLVAALLSFRSVVNLAQVDLGFRTRDVQAATLHFQAARYPSQDAVRAFQDELVAALETSPRVAAAAFADETPLLDGPAARYPYEVSGHSSAEGPSASTGAAHGSTEELHASTGAAHASTVELVGDGYFDVLEIPLLEGRWIRRDEYAQGAPVALVSRALAAAHGEESSPVGSYLRFDDGAVELEVVGVVGDVRREGPSVAPKPETYVPERLLGVVGRLLVRTVPGTTPEELADLLRSSVAGIDPTMAVSGPFDLQAARVAASTAPRVLATLLALFATLTVSIAATGVSGLVAYLVSQRTREIGIRMALGADAGRVLRAVLGDGLRPVILGLLAGLGAAAAGGRLLEGLLFGVGPVDPLSYGLVGLAALAMGALACWAPARRALAVQPTTALRGD